jgi:cbb3-type cytochrome oxidase subunit 3
MGLKGLMSALGMDLYGLIALVLFFGAFVSIIVWTLTRPRKEIEAQSRLWEDDED